MKAKEMSELAESYVANFCLSSPLFYIQVEGVKARADSMLLLAQVRVAKHLTASLSPSRRLCKDTKACVCSEMRNDIPE
jgi:hypothetical protein